MYDIVVYSGAAASIWIVAGIFFVGKFYPGYSHSKQFCSELGATGSTTQKLSPRINNYPLGILFILFGWYVAFISDLAIETKIAGWLIIFHGFATWLAGYFPMDKDPYTASPTLYCKIHIGAGLIMLLSLLIAPLLIVISQQYSIAFRVFSLCCILGTILFLVVLAKATKAQTNPGVHQRVSYGFQLLWLFVFSIVLAH